MFNENKQVNWIVKEHIGVPVYKEIGKTITARNDIKIDDEIYIPGINGDGYIKAIVTDVSKAETEHHIYFLRWNADDRNCWVCDCVINKKVLKLDLCNND